MGNCFEKQEEGPPNDEDEDKDKDKDKDNDKDKEKDKDADNSARKSSADEETQDAEKGNVQVEAPEIVKVDGSLERKESRKDEGSLEKQESSGSGGDERLLEKQGSSSERQESRKDESLVEKQESRKNESSLEKQESPLGKHESSLEKQETLLERRESRKRESLLEKRESRRHESLPEKQESPLKRQEGKPESLLEKQESPLERHDENQDQAKSVVSNPNQENNVEEKTSKQRVTRLTLESAGLQTDSVLRRTTVNVKEFYTIGDTLGQGQFGTTFLCVEKSTGEEYACKTISKRKLTNQEDIEDVRKEIEILYHLKGNPDVITIKDSFEDSMAVHVVMELCSGGELFDRIIERGHYTEKNAAELARTVVSVVQTCHSLGVMHRDLKPENFLFVSDDEGSPLKTIDFGLSVFFKPGDVFHDVVGSPYYVAPEVLANQSGPEADVWSAGVIIYILLCGVPPFWAENEEDIFEEVLNGELDFHSDPWPDISDGVKDLVRKMLERNPKKRLTAHEVLCNPWIKKDGIAPDKPLDHTVISRLQQFSAMNKLKKMALRVIAERLSEEEIAGLKQMFKMIDTDHSGQISYEELKQGLKRFGGANFSESEIRNIMKSTDVDSSGTIDYGEFITAMLQLQRVEREDHLIAAFSYFDKDGSGFITKDELHLACQEFGINESQLEDTISEVDQDNDGRIDYNEFVTMMQKGNVGIGKMGTNKPL